LSTYIKDPVRAAFAAGVSMRCSNEFWRQLEQIQKGERPRAGEERGKRTKQVTVARQLGINRGHLSRILSKKNNNWPLLLSVAFAMEVECGDLSFPAAWCRVCAGFANAMRLLKSDDESPINSLALNDEDVGLLIAMNQSEAWISSKKLRYKSHARKLREGTTSEINTTIEIWLGLHEFRPRTTDELESLEMDWQVELATCLRTIPMLKAVTQNG